MQYERTGTCKKLKYDKMDIVDIASMALGDDYNTGNNSYMYISNAVIERPTKDCIIPKL